jgi:hypothetical protein
MTGATDGCKWEESGAPQVEPIFTQPRYHYSAFHCVWKEVYPFLKQYTEPQSRLALGGNLLGLPYSLRCHLNSVVNSGACFSEARLTMDVAIDQARSVNKVNA